MNHIGIDIIEIARIEQAIAQWGERFLHRVYTESELKLYYKKPLSLAARFAGKEAVIKAIGTQTKGISWQEIEILAEPSGKPLVQLYGKAQDKANDLGLSKMAISLSDSKEYAIACAIVEAKRLRVFRSGAIGNNTNIATRRRFKKHGMSRTIKSGE